MNGFVSNRYSVWLFLSFLLLLLLVACDSDSGGAFIEDIGGVHSSQERVARAYFDAVFAKDCSTALTYVAPDRRSGGIDSFCPNKYLKTVRIDDMVVRERTDIGTGQPYWVVSLLGEFVVEMGGSTIVHDSRTVMVEQVEGKYYAWP